MEKNIMYLIALCLLFSNLMYCFASPQDDCDKAGNVLLKQVFFYNYNHFIYLSKFRFDDKQVVGCVL